MSRSAAFRLLVTGATGLFAPYVLAAGEGLAVTATARHGGDFAADLCDATAVRDLIAATRPDAVIHLAAYTDVDDCEADPARAFAANALATRHLAAALPEDCRLVMISTDQVYPDRPGPHAEGTEAPVNAYGRSKLAGEWAAMTHADTCILRANLFGPSLTPGRASLSDFMAAAFAEGRPVTLFADVLFSPLRMSTLAALAVEMARGTATGAFNAGSRDGMSKADFGLAIARRMGADTGNATLAASATLVGRAPRPRDLRLNLHRIEAVLGRAMPTLAEEIEALALPSNP